MQLKLLNREELETVYEQNLCRDFPREELKPLAVIHRLREGGGYEPFGVLDETGALLGYAFLWRTGDYLLLDYLGVVQERRSQGLGGGILSLLQKECSQWAGILIESEAPTGGAEDATQRRRLAFYQRNGCRMLPYEGWVFGVHFRVLLLETAGQSDDAQALAAHQALYADYLTAEQAQALIRIPFDPAGETPPAIDWATIKRTI